MLFRTLLFRTAPRTMSRLSTTRVAMSAIFFASVVACGDKSVTANGGQVTATAPGAAASGAAIAPTPSASVAEVAASSAASAAPSASAAPAESAEEPSDEYTDELKGDDGSTTPSVAKALHSNFPYKASTTGDPVASIVDDELIHAVREYSCSTGTEHHYRPYFPGIQGFNDTPEPTLKATLAGDAPTANFYVKYAQRSTKGRDEGGTRADAGWSLLFYYNAPKAVEDDPTIPVALEPLSGADTVAGVHVFARSNHSIYRLKTGTPREGDQVEVRLLGEWASTPKSEDFLHASPQFLEDEKFASRDAADFANFKTKVVDSQPFRDFMHRSAYEVAVAFKCGEPVFAHSGGGAVLSWILRALAESPLHEDIHGWNKALNVVGLEAVLTRDLADKLVTTLGPLKEREFVVGEEGSKTYRKVIVKELEECHFHPLEVIGVTDKVDPPGWNGDGGGHGGLGFWVLLNGSLPNATFDATP